MGLEEEHFLVLRVPMHGGLYFKEDIITTPLL